MTRTVLYLPPHYEDSFPPLGTPALTGFLRSKGLEVSQRDLNIEYRDHLAAKVSGEGLSESDRRAFLPPLLWAFFARRMKGRYFSPFLPRRGGEVLPHLPYGNNANSSFHFAERLLSSRHLFRYLADPEANTFLQFYLAAGVIESLEAEGAGLVGLSVISPSQAVAALTLGLLIKKRLPGVHVVLGGQWVTLYREQLKRRDALFACFDSLVVFEGETPLYELCRGLAAGRLGAVPNLITRERRDPPLAPRGEDLDAPACPDFDGLPLDRYHLPKGEVVLTYETSRGCYWNRCAFCVDLPLPKPRYRPKKAAAVASDILRLVRRYGATELMMGDPGMAPRQMWEVSRELLRRKVRVRWWTMARLDPAFDRRIFEAARRAGLMKINFGFESANDRVCGLLGKGNRMEVSRRVIHDCAQAGIAVDLQTMLGMPGETHGDALDTVKFLLENQDDIAAVTFNTYYLTPGNRVFLEPERYGVAFDRKKLLPFQFFIPFKNRLGMTPTQAQRLIDAYHTLRHPAPPPSPARPGRARRVRRAALALCGERVSVRAD